MLDTEEADLLIVSCIAASYVNVCNATENIEHFLFNILRR